MRHRWIDKIIYEYFTAVLANDPFIFMQIAKSRSRPFFNEPPKKKEVSEVTGRKLKKLTNYWKKDRMGVTFDSARSMRIPEVPGTY